jgi:N-acyl-D-amino-acid deacylase
MAEGLEVIVRGGRVFDGAGNPPLNVDVGVRSGRIAELGALNGEADLVLDAEGLFVCPGFVDMHTHSDVVLLTDERHEAKVRQGVTLEVVGQDGLGLIPLTDESLPVLKGLLREWNGDFAMLKLDWRSARGYVAAMNGGMPLNAAFLAPHGSIRLAVMGLAERAPTREELRAMRSLLEECLREGAAGLSTGLQYVPMNLAEEEELVRLCEVVAPFGGYFAPHHRGYGRDVLEANEECIRIARRAGVALHLTHAHLSYPINAGRAHGFLALVDEARAEGLDITLDSYPYTVGNPFLRILLPPWMLEGGEKATLQRLGNPEAQGRLRHELEIDGFEGVPVDWNLLEVSAVNNPANAKWIGSSIAAAAAQAGNEPFDYFCRLLIEDRLGTSVLEHIGNEENVRAIMTHPAHMLGSDAILVGERPHPRGWGTFPRFFGDYVRDLGLLTWEQAIRKVTSLPAQRLGLFDHGLLRPGMAADLVCFDPLAIRETATYTTPRSFAEGIVHVVVNGVPILEAGEHTGERPGRLLRRQNVTGVGLESTVSEASA